MNRFLPTAILSLGLLVTYAQQTPAQGEPQAPAQAPQALAQEPQAPAQAPQAPAQEPQVSAQASQAAAQEPQAPAPDTEALRKDVEALKEGQATILKALKEIQAALPKRREPVEDVDLALRVAEDPSKGEKGARLTLVEFTDYQCPFCARHVRSVLPKLEEDYVNAGKLRYVLRDMPLHIHKDAPKAAEAAHCAGEQGKYWEMYTELFANQKALDPEELPKRAEAVGLDLPGFQACIDSGKYASKVAESLAEGAKAGIRGTPTFLLGVTSADGTEVKATKRIRGAQGYAIFKQAIDGMLSSPAPQAPAGEAGS